MKKQCDFLSRCSIQSQFFSNIHRGNERNNFCGVRLFRGNKLKINIAVRGWTVQRAWNLITSISTVQLLELLGILSILTFIGSLLVVPWLILRLSPDYFIRHRLNVIERHRQHPVLGVIIFFLRNAVGFGLFAAGMAMLLMPGQGILTMFIGLSFMDFPGKHRLLEKMVQVRSVQQSLNWIRRKGGKEDLVFTAEQVEG